jgi:uncharacterized protein YndB with AHSA1/START domain
MDPPVNPTSEVNLRLVVERTFQASRERVFRAWTDPMQMSRWFAPVGMVAQGVEVDLRVGGKFRVGMRGPDGVTHFAFGFYREIHDPERLVFTWTWEQDTEIHLGREMLVTVEFHAQGSATHVVLVHDRIPGEVSKDQHRDGWAGCFETLHRLLTGTGVSP